jgi:ketosteroid isomerase-like protein
MERSVEERLALHAPRLFRFLAALGWMVVGRLSPRSRLRRTVLTRNVARTYDAFNRRDLEAFLTGFHPDAVYDMTHVAGWPDQQRYHGHDGLLEMAHEWFATFDFWFELQEVRDLGGNRCLVMAKDRLTGTGSGVELAPVLWTQLATAKSGLCVRVDNYTDRDEALRAAGLSGTVKAPTGIEPV